MNKILVTFFSLVLLLMAGLVIVPGVINWNQYKDDIATKAKDAIGRDVVVNGDIKLRVLPKPSIIVNDIQIGNPDGFQSNQGFAHIEKISVEAALKPLLKKQIHITGVKLVSPSIHLQKKNGQDNWTFDVKKEDTKSANQENPTSSFKPELSFDEVMISNGALTYQDGTSPAQLIKDISALIKGESLKGPFDVSGDLKYQKIPANFNIKTSSVSDNKPTTVKANLSLDNQNALIELASVVGGQKKSDSTTKVSLSVNDIQRLIANLKNGKAPNLPDMLNKKIRATGDLVASSTQTEIDNLSLSIGQLSLNGKASYSQDKKLGVSLATSTIDLSKGTKNTNSKKNQTSDANASYIKTIDGVFQTTSGLIGTAIPADMTAGFELRIKKLITENQASLDNVKISALLDDKALKISHASADLPGSSAFSLSAHLPLQNQKIAAVHSNISFKGQNLSSALSSFGVTDLPNGLSPLNAQAKIGITKQALTLSDTVLKFGKNSLKGFALSYTPNDDQTLKINTTGGDLDFNTLQSKSKNANNNTAQASAPKNNALGLPESVTKKLDGMNADVKVKLNQIIFGENLARNITIDGKIDNQAIIINQASIGDLGDLNSLNFEVSGVIGQLSPFSDLDLKINAQSDNLSRTLWAFGNKNAGDIGKASFLCTIKGSQENVDLNAKGTIDNGQLTLNGTIKNLAQNPILTGEVKAQHPETSIILKNFLNMKTQSDKMGAFSMSTKVTASKDKLKTDQLDVNMGSQGTIGGHVNFDKTTNPGSIDVNLNADFLPLGKLTGAKTNRVGGGQGATASPKTWSQKPINLGMLRGTQGTIKVNVKKLTYDEFIFNNFKLDGDIQNNSLSLKDLSANMFDGSFKVNGTVSAAATGQAHKGTFNINIDKANVEKVFSAMGSKAFGGGILSWTQDLSFSGASQLAIIKNLNGKGNVIIDNGSFNGLDLDSLATTMDRPNSPSDFLAILEQAEAGGTSNFEKIEAPLTIKNGVIQSDKIAIKSQKSEIDLGGFVNLPSQNLKLDGVVNFTEQRNLPGLGLTISGPLYAPKKKFKTDNILRFYTQKATQELGQKALDKLFGKPKSTEKPAPANDNTPVEGTTTPESTSETTTNVAPTEATGDTNNVAPAETPAPTPQPVEDVEDILKQQGEELLRGLLGGGQ